MKCNKKNCTDPSHFLIHGRMMYGGTKINDYSSQFIITDSPITVQILSQVNLTNVCDSLGILDIEA